MSERDGVIEDESGAEETALDLADVCSYAADLSPLPLIGVEGPDHLVRYVNPAFQRLSKKGAEALIGHPFFAVIPEGRNNDCEEMLDRVLKSGVTESALHQEHTSFVRGVYWSYMAWAILDGKKRPAGVMVQVTDTTDARYTQVQGTAMNEALMLHGLKQNELQDALTQRERVVVMNEALARSLAEQNVVSAALNVRLKRAMQETHHRVKNNLQVIAALAELELDGHAPTVPASALRRISTHVRALASLHDVLTRQMKENESGDSVNSAVSLGELVALLQTSVGSRRILSEITPITLTIQKSASLSLLVSELVSNAAKHGAGDITITLTQNGETALLTVNDTGKGFPSNFDPEAGISTGMELVASLARHDLQGNLAFANLPDGGASVTVTFPTGG